MDNAFHANEDQTWKTLSLTRVYCLTYMSHYHNHTKETLILFLYIAYKLSNKMIYGINEFYFMMEYIIFVQRNG